jgi:hypothetical protein
MQVGLFLGLLGLTVLPISAVVGNYISNIYEDRYMVFLKLSSLWVDKNFQEMLCEFWLPIQQNTCAYKVLRWVHVHMVRWMWKFFGEQEYWVLPTYALLTAQMDIVFYWTRVK